MRVLILFYLVGCLACSSAQNENTEQVEEKPDRPIAFDQEKWKTKEGADYPYRDDMLKTLVYNDTIRTLTKDELLNLLGKPDRINENHLYYLVSQTRLGSWPLRTKTLVIKLSEDDAIVWIKIHE